jgi:hypothetical protein
LIFLGSGRLVRRGVLSLSRFGTGLPARTSTVLYPPDIFVTAAPKHISGGSYHHLYLAWSTTWKNCPRAGLAGYRHRCLSSQEWLDDCPRSHQSSCLSSQRLSPSPSEITACRSCDAGRTFTYTPAPFSSTLVKEREFCFCRRSYLSHHPRLPFAS